MNFFQHQEAAKKKTTTLVVLLIGAVVSLIIIATLVVGVFIYYINNQAGSFSAYQANNLSLLAHLFNLLSSKTFALIALGVTAVVAIASLYKFLQLRQGGRYVAESLGGRLLDSNTDKAEERKILNVVEEMAIASGNPVPPVYLLEDASINAFAAGLSRRDAVIGVTQGCVALLSRDELQGVMAHEFSHIHNGDMRLNMRLIAFLHGILAIGFIGEFMLHGSAYRSYRRDSNRGQQLLLGLALVAIGYGGTFFGNIIKAAVSRQREFLADASAVQFTRNPTGISGALKKIASASYGSQLRNSNAAEFSHMLFGQGIPLHLNALMATHPPLPERIRRIEPRWDGKLPGIEPQSAEATSPSPQMEQHHGATYARSQAPISSLAESSTTPQALHLDEDTIEHIGEASPESLLAAQHFIRRLPTSLSQAAHEPFSARALIYCLLLDDRTKIQRMQLQHLSRHAHPATFKEVQTLLKTVLQLGREKYLLLLDLSMPALKRLSTPQYQVFKKNLATLIKVDKQVTLFEWCLYRIVTHNLENVRSKENKCLYACPSSVEVLLSAVVFAGRNANPSQAFKAGTAITKITGLKLLGGYSFQGMGKALNELSQLKPLEKPVLLKAIMACIQADHQVTAEEAELFRAIADTLNCPVPPFYSQAIA